VGTVALGYVASGTIRRHDDLKLLPTTKTTQVRSIQKHDDDFDVASKGDRVGLALKNVETEDLDRGYVLSNQPAINVEQTIEAGAELVKYWKAPLKEGMVMHVGHWMQFLSSRVVSMEEGGDWRRLRLKISLEKSMVYESGSKAVLNYLEGGRLRVVGKLSLP
jgi:selenocysteine-specific translation elongation factor